ncbi:MAG: hypothetical protein KBG96_05060, partial [Paludibacter sp.]|nr:hypothetical protein [Paludibacter sp.]
KMRSMKKVLVTLLVAFATVSGSMAMELNEYKVFYKLNNEVTFKSLNRYLKLEEGQQIKLKDKFALLENDIKVALNEGNAEAAELSMNEGLEYLRSVLSEEQFDKFVLALNATINYSREILYAAN